MFLSQLTRTQRQAFLSLARELVEADGVMTLGEVIATTALGRELGLDDTGEVRPLAEAADAFDSRSSRVIALIELTLLAHADGSSAGAENSTLRRLALMWTIDGAEMREIENWVLQHRRLVREAHHLIRGDLPD